MEKPPETTDFESQPLEEEMQEAAPTILTPEKAHALLNAPKLTGENQSIIATLSVRYRVSPDEILNDLIASALAHAQSVHFDNMFGMMLNMPDPNNQPKIVKPGDRVLSLVKQ